MGQKVSPHGLRVGIIKDWDSKWYADKKDFADYLVEDHKIREFVKKRLYAAGVSKILIDRAANNQVKITVLTGKPGMVIGRSGNGIDELKAEAEKLTGKSTLINIVEIKRIELDAQLTAESIAQALEKRISFRRAMKQAIGRTMKSGAKGIKVLVSGRLGGAEIARSENTAKEMFRSIRLEPISTMDLLKQIQLTARLESKSGSTMARSLRRVKERDSGR